MTSQGESADATDGPQAVIMKEVEAEVESNKDISLHKRRRGEPPASLAVKPQTTASDADVSSPCTAGVTPEDDWFATETDYQTNDPKAFCESMLKRLKDREDPLSKRAKNLAATTNDTIEALNQLERLFELLDQFIQLKEQNSSLLKRLRDVNQLKKMHKAYKQIDLETGRLKAECKEVQLINEALDALELESEYSYGEAILDNVLYGGRGMKRTGSKWKGHSRFGGSLLRKQRSRSAGGDDSDVSQATPLRRRSEGIAMKEVEKSKVSKWTKVKAAFR
ncbi:hypothetical protein EVAR_96216_1 [Eumeta japonica]|uniref:Uncharacterized protein n=1 Tax=Eumeta variegata TaxID=151549 RepID=A0A4C1WL99_EUMVA|nr:hypothetical protein EVAR_96216_1 [Eumeta japonica]